MTKGNPSINVRLPEEVFNLLREAALRTTPSGEKPNLAGYARDLLVRSLLEEEKPANSPGLTADFVGADGIAILRTEMEAHAKHQRLLLHTALRLVLGVLITDRTERKRLDEVIEQTFGPKSELKGFSAP